MYCVFIASMLVQSIILQLESYWWYLPVILGLVLLGGAVQWLLLRKAPGRRKWLLLAVLGAIALLVDLVILVGMPFGWGGQVQWLLLYTLHWLPLGVVSLAIGAILVAAVSGLISVRKKEA